MAVGVLVGLTLGPRSGLLERDRIISERGGQAELYERPDPEAKRVAPGTRTRLRLRVVGQRKGQDEQSWYEVRFQRSGDAFTGAGRGESRQVRAFVPMDRAPPVVSNTGYDILRWLDPVGRLFLRLIKMVIVPLVFCSLLVGVASLKDLGKLGRMGGMTFGYFLATTAIAITLGLVAANAVRPGRYISPKDRDQLSRSYAAEAREKSEAKVKKGKGPIHDTALDQVVDMVPDVPLHAATRKTPAMLQVIVFALFMGIGFILVGPDKARAGLALFDSINEVMIKIVQLVMELAPFGVLALLAGVTGSAGASVLGALAAYSGVVLAALLVHGTVVYGLAVRFLSGFSLRSFYRGIRPAQLIAFSTSSSSATLPVSIRVAQEQLGVSGRAAGFVLPLGATINMDGTALYQGVAAVFIAQVFGMDLNLGQQLEVLFTATLASVGAAGVPGAGIFTLAMVLQSIGVPTAGIALILGVDRLLDMFRTAVNVTGDLSCTVFVARRAGEFVEPAVASGPDVAEQPKAPAGEVSAADKDTKAPDERA